MTRVERVTPKVGSSLLGRKSRARSGNAAGSGGVRNAGKREQLATIANGSGRG
jgi:hypothetical protein